MARKRTIVTDIFGMPTEPSINQKLKGNKNELVAAKFLTKWTGVEFVRTPSSGGRRLRNAKNFCGDVVCCDDDYDFPMAVETKHLKQVYITETLRTNSEIYKIWKQAERDGRRAGKHPMLMLRQNGMKAGTFYCFVSRPVSLFFTERGARVISNGDGIVGFHSDTLSTFPFDEKLRIKLRSLTFGVK